uniref:Z58f protein n=1 Tax=Vibrio cholerae TaxID=666 RepID=O87061_VIBCL|nr:z58f [Vibrio cholerae]
MFQACEMLLLKCELVSNGQETWESMFDDLQDKSIDILAPITVSQQRKNSLTSVKATTTHKRFWSNVNTIKTMCIAMCLSWWLNVLASSKTIFLKSCYSRCCRTRSCSATQVRKRKFKPY